MDEQKRRPAYGSRREGEEERKKGLIGPIVEGCSSWQPKVGLRDIGPIWAQELRAEFAVLG